jgi:hypothetical protein
LSRRRCVTGDVLLRRRSVTETFCMETFCRRDALCKDVLCKDVLYVRQYSTIYDANFLYPENATGTVGRRVVSNRWLWWYSIQVDGRN